MSDEERLKISPKSKKQKMILSTDADTAIEFMLLHYRRSANIDIMQYASVQTYQGTVTLYAEFCRMNIAVIITV